MRKKVEHGTTYHMGVSPRHMLLLRGYGHPWEEILEGGRPEGATDEELDAQVRADLAAGKVYPIGNACPEWDEKEGCPGHPY